MEMTLSQQYLNTKQVHPELSSRDLAQRLNISEAELAYVRVGEDAERLDISATTLLTELETVGVTCSVTSNPHAVHQQMGEYRNLRLHGHLGLLLNPRALDLRLFFRHWNTVFSLRETTAQGEQLSIQCFDFQGNAIHQIYCTTETNQAAWQALIAKYRMTDNPRLELKHIDEQPNAGSAIDGSIIDTEWRKMNDIHQFFMLLKRHNISRQQAFRAVGDDLAYQVDNQAVIHILKAAQAGLNEIMLFVGNSGCMQIFTGAIDKFSAPEEEQLAGGQWVNVSNPRFDLQLNQQAIAESWVTRKPTKDGFVSSLELLDEHGKHILQIFGQRSEGQPEQTQWHQQLAELTPIGVPHE
ncbi:TPA: hemin-degrading factor [Yersinia enterocolitica]|nr:hemin-degrading factor [Yersinia enterocolitica]EKN3395942.1 hemin-degrading factor [Yersinia enterocolitica]EKN3441575.1 hemin-degrading factor [Yersinia enterocolitica]EKN3511876.1 hemin-degrading factor [Yersinia enterocolitica]EKN3573403.1 hemin-degrading factor [Yersinia enterocolitica]EKN3577277.1 hemin-degrading factor [Yersinia enterocolitica]